MTKPGMRNFSNIVLDYIYSYHVIIIITYLFFLFFFLNKARGKEDLSLCMFSAHTQAVSVWPTSRGRLEMHVFVCFNIN